MDGYFHQLERDHALDLNSARVGSTSTPDPARTDTTGPRPGVGTYPGPESGPPADTTASSAAPAASLGSDRDLPRGVTADDPWHAGTDTMWMLPGGPADGVRVVTGPNGRIAIELDREHAQVLGRALAQYDVLVTSPLAVAMPVEGFERDVWIHLYVDLLIAAAAQGLAGHAVSVAFDQAVPSHPAAAGDQVHVPSSAEEPRP